MDVELCQPYSTLVTNLNPEDPEINDRAATGGKAAKAWFLAGF
jgi:hypothetical protein